MADGSCSIVEYFAEHENYQCGYCKTSDGNYSHGMWAHALTPLDYQNLIDRGWRRSGKYCYKPTMTLTCCPQYTIRNEALNLKLSKSQKAVIKRMNKYLNTGNTHNRVYSPCHTTKESTSSGSAIVVADNAANAAAEVDETGCDDMEWKVVTAARSKVKLQESAETLVSMVSDSTTDVAEPDAPVVVVTTKPQAIPTAGGGDDDEEAVDDVQYKKPQPRPGDGVDPLRPPCKKAKLRRAEKRQKKLAKEADAKKKIGGGNPNVPMVHGPKSLEDFLKEIDKRPLHKLEIELVQSCPPSRRFAQTEDEAFLLYQKYQTVVHREEPAECDKRSYLNFLVESPLEHVPDEEGPACGYGSFHQQYRVDGKLIAVGVLDILPRCVSSVYFFYDPDYMFLSLGTYASMREIALTRELQKQAQDLKYYYLGFYIHSCPKMRYKGQYNPSFLLCPEVYSWNPIERCRPKLDENKYSRLDDDEQKEDRNLVQNIHDVPVLYAHRAVTYFSYVRLNPRAEDELEVRQYCKLVGRKCGLKMLLYRAT